MHRSSLCFSRVGPNFCYVSRSRRGRHKDIGRHYGLAANDQSDLRGYGTSNRHPSRYFFTSYGGCGANKGHLPNSGCVSVTLGSRPSTSTRVQYHRLTVRTASRLWCDTLQNVVTLGGRDSRLPTASFSVFRFGTDK